MEVVRLSSQDEEKLEDVYTSSNSQGGLSDAKRGRPRFIDVGKRALKIIDPLPERIHSFGFVHTLPSSITQPTPHGTSMTRIMSIDIEINAEPRSESVFLSDPRLRMEGQLTWELETGTCRTRYT